MSAALKDRGVLSLRQAATYLNTSHHRVPKLVADGHIKGYFTGTRWRISRESCDAYIRECMNAGEDVAEAVPA